MAKYNHSTTVLENAISEGGIKIKKIKSSNSIVYFYFTNHLR